MRRALTSPRETELQSLNLDASKTAGATFMRGKGCNDCNKTTYRGPLRHFRDICH